MRIRRLAVIAAALAALALPAAVSTTSASARTGTLPDTAVSGRQVFTPAGVVTAESRRAVGSGFQYHYTNFGTAYVNAWGGGPWVRVFDSSAVNNDFTIIQNPQSGFQMLKRTNGSGGNACIGDANNDPGDARTSLDSCGSPIGVGNGWGTDWVAASGSPCPAGQWYFSNKHWSNPNNNTYLGPPDNFTNGDPFYLNKPVAYCFVRSAAA